MKKKTNTSSQPAVQREIAAPEPALASDNEKRNDPVGSIEEFDEELEDTDGEDEEDDRYRRGGIYEDDIDEGDGSKQDGRYTMLNY